LIPLVVTDYLTILSAQFSGRRDLSCQWQCPSLCYFYSLSALIRRFLLRLSGLSLHTNLTLPPTNPTKDQFAVYVSASFQTHCLSRVDVANPSYKMLLLPLRSPRHPRGHHDHDDATYTTSLQGLQSSKPSSAPHMQRQSGDSMTAMMPTTTAPASKRPKLSLQTSNASALHAGHKSRSALNLSLVTQTPTYSNTYSIAFNDPSVGTSSAPNDNKHSPQSSPDEHSSPSSLSSSATTLTSCHTSPFPSLTPYSLPLGPRSILRNSPLPRKLLSATSTRTPKLLFPRPKKVCFREELEDLIPSFIVDETPAASKTSDSDASDKRLEDDIVERKALDNMLEEEATTFHVCGRRKRRRDWIWRPLEDDILSPRHRDVPDVKTATGALPSSHRPIPELKREITFAENLQCPCGSFGKLTANNGAPQSRYEDGEALIVPESVAADSHVATTTQHIANKGL